MQRTKLQFEKKKKSLVKNKEKVLIQEAEMVTNKKYCLELTTNDTMAGGDKTVKKKERAERK